LNKGPASTAVTPSLSISHVLVAHIDKKSIYIPISFKTASTSQTVEKEEALADTGASGRFIDETYARKLRIPRIALKQPIDVYNVDGTLNKKGTITHYVRILMTIGGRTKWETFYCTGLGKQRIILGLPWFRENNPIIDWETGHVSWRIKNQDIRKIQIKKIKKEKIEQEGQEEELDLLLRYINGELLENEPEWIRTKITASQNLALKHEEVKKEKPVEEIVPPQFHDFLKVFDKEASDRFPTSKPWDHKIEMKEGFEPKSFKTYNLTPEETKELDSFLEEQLAKGYIRPSKSPMVSPFFFVSKKDGKLRPCQDYRYLNEWTIKNAYPLPLISELLDKLKGAKLFTKFDVRWGYNNIRIKKGDEWKAAFKTNKGLFEPTVMFFGMCNSPATFQAMMDSIFKDLIAEGLIIVYMDDILIFAKDKQQLDKITRKVLQRLQENDLYLKPEKCSFEKTKIDYLGMIIEEGKISMDPTKQRNPRLASSKNSQTSPIILRIRQFLSTIHQMIF